MISARFVAALGLAYLAGHLAHETTHILAVLATGADLERVRFQAVIFRASPPTEHVIQAAPILALPALVAVLAWVAAPADIRESLVVAAFLAGYFPRSASDWSGARALLG